MNLDEAQRQQVAKWIEEGLKLSEIQSKLASAYGVRMTYMEVRFLIDDLKLKPRDKEPPPTPVLPKATAAPNQAPGATPQAGPGRQPPSPDDEADLEDDALAGAANVSVSVDQVTRPGALVSGKVTFSDSQTAEWYLDQMGRLGVVAKQQGYKPSQADLMAFQAELQNQLARMGY
jgi:hypothetical protein